MNYIKLTERNEHEGETWRFYIPIMYNEKAIFLLKGFIDSTDEEEWYELDETPIPEAEVDILVKHSGGDYMKDQNKLEGVLKLPEFIEKMDLTRTWGYGELEELVGDDGDQNFLYKGGLRGCMEVEE